MTTVLKTSNNCQPKRSTTTDSSHVRRRPSPGQYPISLPKIPTPLLPLALGLQKASSMAFSLILSKPFSPSCNPNPHSDLSRSHLLSNPWLSPSSSRSGPISSLSRSSPVLLSRPWTRPGAARCSLRSRPEYIPNHIPDPHYVRIFDTTLRDGEQSPGATMTSKEKLIVARQLARLGVDIIEAGFPASSPDDLDAVRSIAMDIGNQGSEDGHIPVICGLARSNKKDIDAAWEAVRHARKPRVHTFIATSEIHMQHKLKKTREEVVRLAREMVAYARSLGCQDVEFSPEDAGRFFFNTLLKCFPF